MEDAIFRGPLPKPRASIRIWECRTATSQMEPGEWRYKRLHSELKHQNTTDSRISLRDLLSPVITRVYTTIEI